MAEPFVAEVHIHKTYALKPREGILLVAIDRQGDFLLEAFVSEQRIQVELMRTLLLYYESPEEALIRLMGQRGMSFRGFYRLNTVFSKDPEVEHYYVFVASDVHCLNTQGLLKIDAETLLAYIGTRILQRPEDLQALRDYLKK